MLASFLRKSGGRRGSQRSPFAHLYADGQYRSSVHDAEDEDESASEPGRHPHHRRHRHDHDEDDEDEDEHLLPIFSSEVLDTIPIYHHTHSIRILVIQRCETTLSWDQLRSPQVSQFLVKPIQQQIQASHFSRGTLYALIANTLQFGKEGQTHPGNIGVTRTRAMICELLAMRLIKEFSTRELVDALSYDFNPLQGMAQPAFAGPRSKPIADSARMSTLEIAIRAQAKKFLSHSVVVRHLEAIWAGTIVFHSAADELHRKPPSRPSQQSLGRSYGTLDAPPSPHSPSSKQKGKAPTTRAGSSGSGPTSLRRSVTLYNPRDASLFKLSRLRVPRYRHLFSTCSFAVMLGLFLSVLVRKSLDITGLEILFWFWSAGYMLDEIVGFTEQGFGLYIMSVWNAFDLGILLLFVIYYILRLYGILMPDVQKHYIATMAYDVLASTAVLLFPRLFSVLDHYRYFSQLLIAFRLMAQDLVALLCLIIVACSGFFVAFTLSFSGKEFDAANVAYALFQMLMGFTPAAWDLWPDLPLLGRSILVLFLFICHFLIVTILITVLTNSFMAVVQNADTEHSYLLAVNTISMVKSDSLFSYIPPTNIIGWLLIPIQYIIGFRQFIRMNRTIIKVSHLPILFLIFLYERLIMSNLAYEPTDLVERRGREETRFTAFSIRGRGDLFSPGARLREPSVTTFQKDRALEEVFRRPFRDSISKHPDEAIVAGRRKSSTAVHDWMQGLGTDGGASPPLEQPRSVLDRLEARRPRLRRADTTQGYPYRRKTVGLSAAVPKSDPEDAMPKSRLSRPQPIEEEEDLAMSMDDIQQQQTDADGDDELVTNDEDDRITSERGSNKETRPVSKHKRPHSSSDNDEYFRTPMTVKAHTPAFPSSMVSSKASRPFVSPPATNPMPSETPSKPSRRTMAHSRNLSTNTVLFNPYHPSQQSSGSVSPPKKSHGTRSGTATPGAGLRTPKSYRGAMTPIADLSSSARPRAIMPPRRGKSSVNSFLLDRNTSLTAAALDLASDLGDNRYGPYPGAPYPASFSTQLELAAKMRERENVEEEEDEEGNNVVGKLVLARMQTLEENFREVLGELRGLREDERERKSSRRSSRVRKGKRKNGVVSATGSIGGNTIEEAVERSSV